MRISGWSSDVCSSDLHEARIWTEKRSDIQLQINSMKRLSGGENGLLAYYPMTEGKGDLAYDKAHGAHARFYGQWTTPAGKAVAFGGNGYLAVNTASEIGRASCRERVCRDV